MLAILFAASALAFALLAGYIAFTLGRGASQPRPWWVIAAALFIGAVLILAYLLPAAPPGSWLGEGAGLAALALLIALAFYVGLLGVRPQMGHSQDSSDALGDSERKFRALAESAHCAIFLAREHFLYVNPEGERISGYTQAELQGMHTWDVVNAAERERTRKRLLARLRGEGRHERVQIRIRTKQGELRWIEYTAEMLQFEGVPTVVGTAFDVTELKRTEQALRASEQRFSRAFHSSPSLIAIYDQTQQRLLDVNESFCETTGFDCRDLLAQPFDDLDSDDRQRSLQALMTLLESGEPLRNREITVRRKDDGDMNLLVSVDPIEIDGRPCLLLTARDLTVVKQSQSERLAQERLIREQMAALFELARMPFDKNNDFQHRIERVTEIAVEQLELDRADLWLIDSEAEILSCVDRFEPGRDGHQCVDSLSETEFQPRFARLEQHLIVAVDSVADEAAKGDPYFARLAEAGVASQMTVVIRMEGAVAGTLCLEVDDEPWQWTLEEAQFASSLGDMVALALTEQKRRRAEAELYREKELAQITVRSIGDGVITTDNEGHVVYLNPLAEQLTGWEAHEAEGEPLLNVLKLVDETARTVIPDPVRRCLRQGHSIRLEGSLLLIHRTEPRENSVEVAVSPLHGPDQSTRGVVIVFHDVTELRGMARQMSYQAAHDGLTGLINRREFESRLDSALDSAQAGTRQHALCYLDLDQFKVVNDTCGHAAGDELLRRISAELRTALRDTDTFARLGGDEFGALLEDCDIAQAERVATHLKDVIKDFRFVWKDALFRVGVSIGVVPITAEAGNIADVLSAADSACYVAKDQGSNHVHVFQDDDTAMARHHGHMTWVHRIQHALKHDCFTLYFQPVLSINGERQAARGEMLLRMQDGDGGVVLPSAFIPAAERYHLMPDVDRWVVGTVIDLMAGRHVLVNSLRSCSINLSGQSVADEGVQEFILERIRSADIDPSRLCFEITETAVIGNLNRASRFLQELRELGCCLALDDFGSGLSSFAYLKSLPVDVLKIDGRFVRYINDDAMDRAMVESIHQIGHATGIKTVAEFVENQEIVDTLRQIGVDYAQGFYLGKPAPLSD